MSIVIGAEHTKRITAELEQLMEEVRQRTKATITGVKIPDLGEAQAVDGTEILIIEGKNGTQRILASNIPVKEVIDARAGEQTLGDRLDKIDASINDNANNIVANANAINVTNKEVIDARTNANGVTKTNLKTRLDDEHNSLNGLIATNRNNITSVTNEVTQARNGQQDLKTRIDGIEAVANNAQNVANTANNTANTNTGLINNLSATQAQHENRITTLEQTSTAGIVNEVQNARNDGTTVHQTLKDRLDADLAKTTANTNQINNILNAMIGYRVV